MERKRKILSCICALALIFTLLPVGAFAQQSSDIANHWAKDQINALIGEGAIKGYADGSFKPDNDITRAEFMQMINKAFDLTKEADIDFKDVPSSAWYYKTVKQAKAAGYIGGYPDGTMKPDAPITRQEAAVIVKKVAGIADNSDLSMGFIDASTISDYSKNAVKAVYTSGVITGYPDSSFKPNNHLTRAEAVVILCRALDLQNAQAATMILKNGAIYTMDSKGSIVSAIAVKNDKIIYVGDDAGVQKYTGYGTKVVDLKGKMVTPGFVDGHIHAKVAPDPEKINLGSIDPPTVQAYTDAIKAYALAHPDLKVIKGGGMQIKAFSDSVPKASMIDAAVTDRPAAIHDSSGHGALLNTAAMKYIGLTKDTQAPKGGTIYKDKDGNPTGYLSDCLSLVSEVENIDPPKEVTEQQCIDSFKEFETQMNSEGLTAICNGGTSEVPNPKLWKYMDDYSKTGDMSMRVNFAEFASSYTIDGAKQCVDDLNAAQKYNSDFQHVSQVKLLIDGVPEGKTALLVDPYDAAAGMASDYRGPQYCTQDQLNQFVALVDKSGYQVFIHTMGDGGANMDLNAFEYAQKQNGKRDSRHTMVHANFVDKSDMSRMTNLGVYAALQPIWAYFDPTFSGLEKKNLGADRFMKEYAVRDMVNAGITITGSADWPVTSDNRPLSGIEVGVTQCSPYPGQQGNPTYLRNPNQTVTVMDMLKFFTINGAKQMFMEDKIGSLEVGKKADIVILAKDITKIDPKDISETEIINTISNGKIVYSK